MPGGMSVPKSSAKTGRPIRLQSGVQRSTALPGFDDHQGAAEPGNYGVARHGRTYVPRLRWWKLREHEGPLGIKTVLSEDSLAPEVDHSLR